VDNNLFLSDLSLQDWSEGGAYVHNLFTGRMLSRPEPNRRTPYHQAHSTALAGLSTTRGGDNRFYNNLFLGGSESPAAALGKETGPQRVSGYGLWVYDTRELPLETGGNAYYNGARPYSKETKPVTAGARARAEVVEDGGSVYLQLELGQDVERAATARVTTALLGKAKVPGLAYENTDGSPVAVDSDFAGKKRKQVNPTAGPFEDPGPGKLRIKVW
jgi:hypothetical protein